MVESDNGDRTLAASDLENLSFEEAMKLFEATVAELESGGLSLAEAMDRYERGVMLAKRCNDMLAAAELRITRIRAEYGQHSAPQIDALIDPMDDEE